MCQTLHSKIVHSFKNFIVVKVEGIGGRQCLVLEKIPVPCMGTIGVKSWKFKKVKKKISHDFLNSLDIVGV